jgi:hypothetical protein
MVANPEQSDDKSGLGTTKLTSKIFFTKNLFHDFRAI